MPSYILSKCEFSLHCEWACAFSDVQLDQMICCIGHNRMVFLCCGLACGYSDVLLDQMSSCKLNNCVSFLLCGWACAFSDVELYQMTYCIDTSMIFFFAIVPFLHHHLWWDFVTWQIPTIIITDKNPPWWESVMVGICWVTAIIISFQKMYGFGGLGEVEVEIW